MRREIIINDIKYSFDCIFVTKRGFKNNIGVHCQLQVFKEGYQLDKNEIGSYAMEKIEQYIMEIINNV
jgi:hypothetical protein